jgi:hypothetical protein
LGGAIIPDIARFDGIRSQCAVVAEAKAVVKWVDVISTISG